MTLTKMIRVLKSLSEKFGSDFEVFHLMDYWVMKKMREICLPKYIRRELNNIV